MVTAELKSYSEYTFFHNTAYTKYNAKFEMARVRSSAGHHNYEVLFDTEWTPR